MPDWVVVPSGNLGHITAIGRGFKAAARDGIIDRLPRPCAAQAAAGGPSTVCVAYRDGWRYAPVVTGKRRRPAIRIGHPVNVEKAIAILREFDGVLVEQASEAEITQAWVEADRHGAVRRSAHRRGAGGAASSDGGGHRGEGARSRSGGQARRTAWKFGLKLRHHTQTAGGPGHNPPRLVPARPDALGRSAAAAFGGYGRIGGAVVTARRGGVFRRSRCDAEGRRATCDRAPWGGESPVSPQTHAGHRGCWLPNLLS